MYFSFHITVSGGDLKVSFNSEKYHWIYTATVFNKEYDYYSF